MNIRQILQTSHGLSLRIWERKIIATMLNSKEIKRRIPKEADKSGEPEDWFRLGMRYFIGDNIAQNDVKAFKWFHKAATHGHPKAEYYLGLCYECGYGVNKDVVAAVECYRKAAEQGDDEAQDAMGDCYYYGKGVSKDEAEAVKWYRKAAKQGLVDSQYKLGECYYFGRGVCWNYEEAVKWYREAATEEYVRAKYDVYAEAQYRLGECYMHGLGVAKDEAEAITCYRESAKYDCVSAMCALGLHYMYGHGVPVNKKPEAVKWLRKAARLGDYRAQRILEDCYLGQGGTDDAMRYRTAVVQGCPYLIRDYYVAENSGGEISDTFWYDEHDDFSEFENHEDALLEGQWIFEHFLWRHKRVDATRTRPLISYDDTTEPPYLPLNYEIGLLDGMANYYQNHNVNDDDLDAIQEIMMHSVDDLDLFEGTSEHPLLRYVYEKALSVLERRHVIVDVETGGITKSLEEVMESTNKGGEWYRNWDQIGSSNTGPEWLGDVIPDTKADYIDTFILNEWVRYAVNTLPDKQKQVVELRFGLGGEKPLTLEETARVFNVTKERVRQIEKKAKNELLCLFVGKKAKKEAVTSTIQPHLLRGRVRLGSVEMSIQNWLVTLDMIPEDLNVYMAQHGQPMSLSPLRFKEIMVLYINTLATENKKNPAEIMDLLGKGYSLRQALAGEEAIPDNALNVILEIDGYEYTVDEWVNDMSVAESTRRHRNRAVFCNGKFDPQAMVSGIMAAHNKIARQRQRRKEERENTTLEWKGEKKSAREWAEITGIPLQIILNRLGAKWSIEEILTIPYPSGRIIELNGRHYTDEMFQKEYKMPYEKWIHKKNKNRRKR